MRNPNPEGLKESRTRAMIGRNVQSEPPKNEKIAMRISTVLTCGTFLTYLHCADRPEKPFGRQRLYGGFVPPAKKRATITR